jgi:hypothetical protein
VSLKIGPIVDRAPVKLGVLLPPSTHDALADYARIHAQAFGKELPLGDLAALMIDRFLASDAAFRRARKSLRQPKAATE